MLEFKRYERRFRGNTLIPLIDIALFLLIFFMVAGTVMKFEIIPITPPNAESGKHVDEGHIVLLIGKLDEIVMDDTLFTLDELQKEITTQLAANPDKVITIKADAEVPAVRMIALMDRLKQAGAKQVSLATQKAPVTHE